MAATILLKSRLDHVTLPLKGPQEFPTFLKVNFKALMMFSGTQFSHSALILAIATLAFCCSE